jgi:predicted TIM-barrel fold metal-dependent hydrolase
MLYLPRRKQTQPASRGRRRVSANIAAPTPRNAAIVIDFRVRPPYRSFLNLSMYRGTMPGMTVRGSNPLPRGATERSMPVFLDELRQANVVHAVIWGRMVADAKESTANEDVAQLVREHPRLFSGFGGIRIPVAGEVSRAVEDVETILGEHALQGITIEPGFSMTPTRGADDPRLYPIYERCARLGGILALTISVRAGEDMTYSNPVAVDRVAGDFPALQIVVSHAFWPWIDQSIGLLFRRPNVSLLPDQYGPTMPGHLQWVEAANTTLASRFLFGSAYPSSLDPKGMIDAYAKLPYREEVKRKVFYENAARLLKLDQRASAA